MNKPMGKVFITGDKHGDYREVEEFCLKWNTSKDDLMIILGDNGVNYFGGAKDKRCKERLSCLPMSFFMIRGNHDQRPNKNYKEVKNAHPLVKGPCLVEDEFPSLVFAREYGEYKFFTFDAWKKAFIIAGAYSVDKEYRLYMNEVGYKQYRWFYDEQLYEREREEAERLIKNFKGYIMSHTCPMKYVPFDSFSPSGPGDNCDRTMERWMDKLEETVRYDKWFCGHYHIDKSIDKVKFMYHDIVELI